MSKPSLILIGAGGHARACIDVIEEHGHFQIAGLIGAPDELNSRCMGHTVIATDNDLPQLVHRYQYAFIAVGQIQSPDIRRRLYQQATALGFQLPTIVAPTAHVSRGATVGAGTIVMHGAIVGPGTRVGSNCIINTRALLEHDVQIGDHCHISTGAILNGAVSVGSGGFVGSGSIIKEGVMLGECCLVGMGLSVRHHLDDHERLVGNAKS